MKHIKQDFCTWVMPQGWDLGASGVRRDRHVAYQIDWDDETNRMQVKFSPTGQTGNLGVKSKGQISLNFNYKVNFKDFHTRLCVCSHK